MRKKETYTADNGEYLIKKSKGLDIAAKIMSVMIAFIVWLYVIFVNGPVSDSEVYELRISGVSVSVVNNTFGLNGFIGSDQTVTVTVKGNRSDVIPLTPKDIKASVDASELKPGVYDLEIKAELPGKNMEISEISPETVSVKISKQTSVQLPIEINAEYFKKSLESDCVIEKIEPDVSYVTVEGPEDELSKIQKASVTIDPESVTSSREAVCGVILYDKEGNAFSSKYVTSSVTNVRVDLYISKYKDVPLEVAYKYGYYNENTVEVSVEPPSVRIKGPVNKINAIDSIRIATIDETAVMEDGPIVYDLSVLDLAEGVEIVDDLKSVTVNIKNKNTAAKTFSVENFMIINQESGLTYTFYPESMNVILRGTVGEYFTYFDESDITVVIDMKNYKGFTGNVNVPVRIEISNSSTECVIYALGSYFIHVEIK